MKYTNMVKILILRFIYKKCKEYKIALIKFPVLLFGGRAKVKKYDCFPSYIVLINIF